MKKIGVLYHPKLASAQPLAENIERRVRDLGADEVWLSSAWDEPRIIDNAHGSHMVITLGGDGTILRTARAISPLGIPILSVNLGRLGFMAESSPEEIFDRLPLFMEGKAWVEERLMLSAGLRTAAASLIARSVDGQAILDPQCTFHALNEIVVARGDRLRVIYVDVTIDGEKGPSYVADGVIVSTPTGSTGYSLSAGGPILHPELQSVIITPIAPHLSVTRALVLPASTRIELDISTDHSAVLSVDGQVDVPLQSGDKVIVSRSQHVTKLLRAQSRTYFYGALARRIR